MLEAVSRPAPEHKADREVVLAMLSKEFEGCGPKQVVPEHKANREIVLVALPGPASQHKADRETVLEAVQQIEATIARIEKKKEKKKKR